MQLLGQFPATRLRRLRHHPAVRDLVREVEINLGDLVMPLFITHGNDIKRPISSMPGQYQISIDKLEQEIIELSDLGINSILLFGIPAHKDAVGSDGYDDNGIIQQAIRLIKSIAPSMLVISDVCFCEYTDHGHCGIIGKVGSQQDLVNDETLDILAKQAVSHAKQGADIIAPSGMLDGMIQTIRFALDSAGFTHIPILSYSVKYASSMYGPFREAAQGAPQFGDRKTYQMDYANKEEAIRECALDINEGADMLMVKPAHMYLDIIYKVKQTYPSLPLAAYHTSGEFVMIKAAAEKGWLDEMRAVKEVLTSIKRAGADFIFTYYTKEVAAWIRDGKFK